MFPQGRNLNVGMTQKDTQVGGGLTEALVRRSHIKARIRPSDCQWKKV